METPTTKWQPIATAPRDTPILVTDGEIIVVVEKGLDRRGVDRAWAVGFAVDDLEWGFWWEDITHWMPLPPLPGEQGEQCANQEPYAATERISTTGLHQG